MSKITNLIGTTWRFDGSKFGSIGGEYGTFEIDFTIFLNIVGK